MSQTRKPKGFLTSKDGLERLQTKKREKGYKYEDIRKKANVTLDQVKRLFNPHWGYKIGSEAIELIAGVLDLKPEEIVGSDVWNCAPNASEREATQTDWQNICRTMLEKQKQLTTNRLMRANEMLFDIDRICVDLALVERKQTDKRSEDDNPARSQLYKPDYEETQKLEYKEFLSKVLKSEQSKKVAIIGEPGAGKTTLLQRIAFWILENTDDLPIWISLGNFPNPAPKFKDYLLNDWLEDAILNVTPKVKAEFEEQLMAGKAWLLLDGVDEMAAKSGSPLTVIANRIVGWCSCLRVVLTCRLNVWEANPYSLHSFQTYRTLEFSQEKVEEFIKACFQKNDPELGIGLQQALNQPGKERIKDLVRNPLRLTLLCSTWHWREGKLPDTKAELYQQFVEEVYRWQDKEKEVSTITPEEREQLNAKLKELAVAAIDNETNRFCLRQKFVESVFRDSELFQLALNVGWLNQVGVDAKDPNQRVYAFFHPTFQEYFAALAIDDWDFFLSRAHDNHNPKPVSERYRIFEPQWKEVILLWLGRPHEEVAKEQKEEFIKALVEFEDGCGDFYKYRAYFIAAVGIAEFNDCSRADKIVATIVALSCFYDFDHKKQEWMNFFKPISDAAKAALPECDRRKTIHFLTKLLHTPPYSKIVWYATEPLIPPAEWLIMAAQYLGKLDPGNLDAINTLTELIYICESETDSDLSDFILYQAAHSLKKIDPNNPAIKDRDTGCVENTFDSRWDYWANIGKTKESFLKITKRFSFHLGMILLIDTIKEKFSQEQEAFRFADNLKKIHSNTSNRIDSDVIDILFESLGTTQNESLNLKIANILSLISPKNPIIINSVEKILITTKNEIMCLKAAKSLWKIDPDNSEIVAALIKLIRTVQCDKMLDDIVWGFKCIFQGDLLSLVVSSLRDHLTAQGYENDWQNDCQLYEHCYEVIWHCAQNMTYPAFYQAWHRQEEVDKTTTPNSQSLNQADLPQSLQSAIASDPQLSQIIHLICIDSSKFIDSNNPAAKVYTEMVKRGCPKCDDGIPKTMAELQIYWDLLEIEFDKRIVLVFYTSSADTTSAKDTAMPCPYSETFLLDLSKFGDRICVITHQPFNHIPLKFFTPSHAIEDMKDWLQTID